MPQARGDYLASVYVFGALCRLTNRFRPARIPILMYHSVSDPPRRRSHRYYEICAGPRRFAEQMDYLRAQGYETVGLGDALALPYGPAHSKDRQVVITFDDGSRSVHTNAFPILARCGFHATVFVPTAFIGDRRQTLNGEECLTWGELQELHAHGMTIGSHTATHRQLRTMGRDGIRSEIEGSKRVIEDRMETRVDAFAYPYAFPEEDRGFRLLLRTLLAECGFTCAVSTIVGRVGPGDDAYCLKRLPVNHWDDRRLFAAKLAGGYDWVHTVQLLAKTLKRTVGRRVKNREVERK